LRALLGITLLFQKVSHFLRLKVSFLIVAQNLFDEHSCFFNETECRRSGCKVNVVKLGIKFSSATCAACVDQTILQLCDLRKSSREKDMLYDVGDFEKPSTSDNAVFGICFEPFLPDSSRKCVRIFEGFY
jgi:hypothetical protein